VSRFAPSFSPDEKYDRMKKLMSAMPTLSVKILNPKARNILDDLANDGLI